LVVEDFKPFRSFISSLFQEKQELYVLHEVSDGAEAVRCALELNPDLILMDIGLPTLNGIEAARRICQSIPQSRIVFLTQETSAEVFEEARKVGASGYVHKSRAATDLFRVVAAVLGGEPFVSGGLDGCGVTEGRIEAGAEQPLIPSETHR
jgi:DNA-binding NarL/FixJ family response regulator